MYIPKVTKALLQISQDPILQKQEKGQCYGELEAGDHRRTEWGGNSPSIEGQEQAGEERQEHAHREGEGLEPPRGSHAVLPCSVLQVDVMKRPQ